MTDDHVERDTRGDFMNRQVGHLLRRAYFRARRNSAEALSAIGDISPIQASAMVTLIGGPLSQVELGRRLDTEPANTYTLVQRLIGADLAAKTVDADDRRVTRVGLSSKGEAVAARLETILAGASRTTMARLSLAEQQRLLELLRKLGDP